jgi:hypothetical protein
MHQGTSGFEFGRVWKGRWEREQEGRRRTDGGDGAMKLFKEGFETSYELFVSRVEVVVNF